MPFLLLSVVFVIWGISYPITAIALGGFDVLTNRCLVQLFGAAALLAQAALHRRRLVVEREAWPDLAIAALLNMTILPVAFTIGVYLLGPGRTAILVYTMPIWAVLFAWLLLAEALTASRLAALVFGAAAVATLVSQDLSHLRNAPLGAALTLLSAMSYGLGTVWLKRRRWRADAAVVALWQLAIGTAPIVAIWFALSWPPDLARAGAKEWLSVLFLGVAANGVAYFAWFRSLERLPAGAAGISALAVPCIGVASSAWLLGERLYPRDLAAMALIGGALLLVLVEQLRARRRAATDPPGYPDPGTG
jgi:drug/metabolite transporter (DMT)-like permease